MSAYEALHARSYDLIYADKPYGEEAAFVVDRLRQLGSDSGAKILDVACGTGRHAIEIAKRGHVVTGLDLNAELLTCARANAEAAGQTIEFVKGDMRSWSPEGDRQFDAATCLFDSLGYAGNDDAVRSVLRNIGSHLVDDGLLAVEVLNAAVMTEHADPLRVRSWTRSDGRELVRIARTDFDPSSGEFTVDYRLIELSPDGRYSQERDVQSSRAFSESDLRRLLDESDYNLVSLEPAYGPPPDDSAPIWHLMAIARLR